MRLLSKEHMTERFAHIRAGLRHAFATHREVSPLSAEDVALLERIAMAVVKRGMAAPAMIFLESLGPMNFLGSQALHFLSPIMDCAFQTKDLERVARLLERRDTITRLIAMLEAHSVSQGTSAQ
jgi:hypothetical protein